MKLLEVGSWVGTPDGLGKVLSVERETHWIGRRPSDTVWVFVEYMDGKRKHWPASRVSRA